MFENMKCTVSLLPKEGNKPEGGFERRPDIIIDCEHPAYDHEVEKEVRDAVNEIFPYYKQLEFLNECSYPYGPAEVMSIQWDKDFSIPPNESRWKFKEEARRILHH